MGQREVIPFRPCGACTALVPAADGCEHWKPGRPPRTAARADRAVRSRAAERTAAEANRKAAADLLASIGLRIDG